jgi:hypothetical protein
LLLLLLCAGACESTLSVSTIQLGRSLNADQTVANHTTVFAPSDTVYVSVHTTGAGSGTLSVRWSYAGRVVGEPKKEIKSRGATEFHLQNAGGFPLGEYSVEVFLDGVSGGTRTFRVEER